MLVIARHGENVKWAKDRGHEVAVIEKEVHLPNKGREVSSFLFFIISNYETLPEEMIFCQGNPFDHCGFFLEEIKSKDKNYYGVTYECEPDGSPHHKGLDIDDVVKRLGLKPQKKYKFKAGGQFKVSRETVLKYPFEWYMKAYEMNMSEEKTPWIFERIWPLIFNTLKI